MTITKEQAVKRIAELRQVLRHEPVDLHAAAAAEIKSIQSAYGIEPNRVTVRITPAGLRKLQGQ